MRRYREMPRLGHSLVFSHSLVHMCQFKNVTNEVAFSLNKEMNSEKGVWLVNHRSVRRT
jgi:hypothetical protein